jgi:hypothetical protein
MAFTREAAFLKWNGDASKKAFKVLQQGYRGAEEQKPASYARALYDGGLLRVIAPTTPRSFSGAILGEDSPSGTANDGSEDISYGSIDDLKLAWAATDLKCKSFEDSDYWDAEWIGSWAPVADWDPKRNYATVPVTLEER